MNNKEMKSVVDMLGQPITKGAIIAYGVRVGNSGTLRIARVKRIERTEYAFKDDAPKLFIGLLSQNGTKLTINNTYMLSPNRAIVISSAEQSDGYKFLINNVKVEE